MAPEQSASPAAYPARPSTPALQEDPVKLSTRNQLPGTVASVTTP